MFINFLRGFDYINNLLFGKIDALIESLPFSEWVSDALIDSIHLIPFLFIIFLFIEIFERFFSNKIKDISKTSKKFGPLLGAIMAGLPQCGFSVIATPLYINKVITRGTLIAIYVSTSDEAIPILLSNPNQFKIILPLLFIKIMLGIITGYLVDLIFEEIDIDNKINSVTDDDDIGCCSHHVIRHKKRELFLHPLKHTISIFIMILVISLGLNYCFEAFGNELLNKLLFNNNIFQPVIAAIIGLIPNCAISVLITMLYMSGILSFASVIAGLSSGAGLGLIVLFRKNTSIRDSLKIVAILLGISIFSGLAISIFFS